MREYINEALEKYIEKGTYPWHMPGHKRKPLFDGMWNQIYAHDFTEAKDLDDMHEPELFIADSLAEMKKVYGTFATYMLVNGSTSGIMTAIHATCRRGGVILAARNCHKAVYNAICMLELEPEYIVPEYVDMTWYGQAEQRVDERTDILGDISPEKVEQMLQKMLEDGRTPGAVIITSPTYEGVISDIRSIAEVVHRYGVYLIVDEAQGAHLEFMKGHETAMRQGADIVIESLHKTMPALTQTSLLHVMNPELDERVRRYLQIFQTSSPSYIFMQSMEKAVAYGANNKTEFEKYRKRLDIFSEKCSELRNIRLFRPDVSRKARNDGLASGGVYDCDEGRLVFVVRAGTVDETGNLFTGVRLADVLADEYGLIVEMSSVSYVICISSVVDSDESYDILFKAVKEIDGMLTHEECLNIPVDMDIISGRQWDVIPGKAWDMPVESVSIEQSEGRIAGGFVYAYPPGIPVLAPGERIDEKAVVGIMTMIRNGLNVSGAEEGRLKVLR